MSKTRRLPIDGPQLSKLRGLREVAERQEAFNHDLLNYLNGIPTGFLGMIPEPVDGTAVASTGAEEQGWAAGAHRHRLDTSGTPGQIITTASAQGAGPGVSLNAHTHQIDPALLYDPVTDPFRVALNG